MLYVDNHRRPLRVGKVQANWSRLFTDDPDVHQLHDFADQLGLTRHWFHQSAAGGTTPFVYPYYDVIETKREEAIAAGAIAVPAAATEHILRRRQELMDKHVETYNLGKALRAAQREVAYLIGLATTHQAVTDAVLTTDPRPQRADCSTLVVAHTPDGQLAWHVPDGDVDTVAHLVHVPVHDPRAQPEPHTTAVNYERVAAVTRRYRAASSVAR